MVFIRSFTPKIYNGKTVEPWIKGQTYTYVVGGQPLCQNEPLYNYALKLDFSTFIEASGRSQTSMYHEALLVEF